LRRVNNAMICRPSGPSPTFSYNSVKGRSELPEYVERYMQGEFKLNDFITHTMGLDDINEAFELMHEGKSIRSVIHFDK
jgi:S-(hydroxymethyl)glutathione dehydrogenase / alcohol dehydrogenase